MGRPILVTKQAGPIWVDCLIDSDQVVAAWDIEPNTSDRRTQIITRFGLQLTIRETAAELYDMLLPLNPKEGLK
jgi:hypothetical protein